MSFLFVVLAVGLLEFRAKTLFQVSSPSEAEVGVACINIIIINFIALIIIINYLIILLSCFSSLPSQISIPCQ